MPYTRLGDIGTLDVNTGVIGGNLCCILTLNNTVQLMGNLELSGIDPTAYIAKLPESMTPIADMVFPVYLESNSELRLVPIKINVQGQIILQTASTNGALYFNSKSGLQVIPMKIDMQDPISNQTGLTDGTLYLNGVEFACADRYYNSEIGNNFAQGTSPMRWNMEEQ